MSTESKHPTLTRSSDDHGTTVFDRLLVSTCLKTLADHFFKAIQDGNLADQNKLFIGDNLSQVGWIGKNNLW